MANGAEFRAPGAAATGAPPLYSGSSPAVQEPLDGVPVNSPSDPEARQNDVVGQLRASMPTDEEPSVVMASVDQAVPVHTKAESEPVAPAALQLLVVTHWRAVRPTATPLSLTGLEVIEDRTEIRSTFAVSQLPIDKWHPALADPTVAAQCWIAFATGHTASP